MKKWFLKLDKCYKVSVLTLLFTIISFLATIYFYTIGMMHLPNGIAFGGLLMSAIYALQGLGENKDKQNNSSTFTMIFIILKFVVLIACSLIIGFMYYRWDKPYLNLFAFIGMYTVSIVSMVVVYMTDKN